MTQKELKISTSRVQDFINCPMLYAYPKEYNIYPIEKTDSLRMGSNWHKIHEVAGGKDDETANALITQHLNQMYENMPDNKTANDWETERITLFYSYHAFRQLFSDDPIEILATEIEFELPYKHPDTGRKLPNCSRRGKIDIIGRYHNTIWVIDLKSTTKAVDNDSSYWDNLRLGIQPSLYLDAARELHQTNFLSKYGIKDNEIISGVLFIAWHKPGIAPAKLTQTDTKKFLETGEYYGIKFNTEEKSSPDECDWTVIVNNTKAEIIPGAKAFAIRETPEMYGARLYDDMVERPNFYFNIKEIPRPETDMIRHRKQLYCVYKAIRNMQKTGGWYGNPQHCEATYKCQYRQLCYHNVDINGPLPDGFIRKEN